MTSTPSCLIDKVSCLLILVFVPRIVRGFRIMALSLSYRVFFMGLSK